MSDWIPSQAGVRDHPKTKRAARMLGVRRSELVGCLHFLWYWALEYAPDGDIEDFEAEDIADASDWPGDPEAFVEALTNCGSKGGAGFLARANGRLVIHDWEENQGDSFRARIKAAAKKRAQRAGKSGQNGDAVPESGDAVPEAGDSVPSPRDLARANDRPTDKTDKTDHRAPAREEAVEKSGTAEELAAWCRKNISGWQPDATDVGVCATWLRTWSEQQVRMVMGRVAEEAAKKRIASPRHYLLTVLKRTYPAQPPPASTVSPPVPGPTAEQQEAAKRIVAEAAAKFRGMEEPDVFAGLDFGEERTERVTA